MVYEAELAARDAAIERSVEGTGSKLTPAEINTYRRLYGTAQGPGLVWTRNVSGAVRNEVEARAIATAHGVVIPEDVEILMVPKGFEGIMLPQPVLEGDAVYATYGDFRIGYGVKNQWKSLYRRNKILVKIRSDVFESDEAIVAVFTHEFYELNRLREMFAAANGVMRGEIIWDLIAPYRPGNLHSKAWDLADAAVQRMREVR